MLNYQSTGGNWCWVHQRYCVYADSLNGTCTTGSANCPHETISVAWNRTLTDEELKKIVAKIDERLK